MTSSSTPEAFWCADIDPEQEPYKILIKRDRLVDETRDNRVIKIKAYYPIDHPSTELPVILWSHGLGGSVDGASFLSRFLASHGFIVIHMQHPGTDSSLWEGKDGHPWDIIRKTHIPRSASLARFEDVPFVLNHLPRWMQDHPDIGDIADLETLGMSGHSFGAMTTEVMAGMQFPDKNDTLKQYKEPRFTAGILYSPVPMEHLTNAPPEEIYGPITLPLFHMTGTEDEFPIEGWSYERRLTIYKNSVHSQRHLLITNGADHMVYNGSRGKLGDNPNREKHEEIIKITALCYWEATLKKNEVAHDWLTGEGFQAYLGTEGRYENTPKNS
ncbi:MAG: hypothetical protein MRY79_08940 [Alphaproteobacteria bacterium]|nr:hypothetical protein [Alphaproteobacteria bacterium]